jgi:multiple sugar transport system ATP-binding protein
MVNAVPPGDRDIAMVFQSYALYPHKTVRENIGFGLKVRKMDKAEIERRVQEAANLLGITNLLDRKPRELSGGQRQRVALGRAITRNPKLFLLDEPLSNLDAKLRVQMRAELKLLFERIQGTVVYVTHDQAEAMTMSDRVVVMHHGVVQQVGTPLEVYNLPSNDFVAGFLGSPAMNFIPCQLRQQGDVVIAERDAFAWHLPLNKDATPRIAANRTWLAGKAVLGIRPEDITVTTNGAEGGIPCRVTLVEHMGSQNIFILQASAQQLTVTTAADFYLEPGTNALLHLNNAKLHFFDVHDGKNLTL